jgi:hypothetical protein
MHPGNLAAKLLKYSRVTAEPTSVTVMDDLWPRLPRLIERRAAGLLNFNSAGTTDNDRILRLWKRIVDPAHPEWNVDATATPEGTRACVLCCALRIAYCVLRIAYCVLLRVLLIVLCCAVRIAYCVLSIEYCVCY